MRFILTLLLSIITVVLVGITHTVKQDGSGDYTTIQAAITSSAHSDTILVYPGTYFENIDYAGKNITLASLELTTGNPAYRDSTIIDGNNNGSCVKSEVALTSAGIYGFTIQHGSGTPYTMYGGEWSRGGGLRIGNAVEFRIYNCMIANNFATNGGGIDVYQATINLKNTIITQNNGVGILFERQSNGIFDVEQRCSVYENYTGAVNDICAADADNIINVYLDMFTVNPPTDYYIHYNKSSPNWLGHFGVIDIQRAYRTEVNHDLYVSPSGDDSNDGLSRDTPLKSITKALHTIASDSLNIKTIYLAPGIYSTDDGQQFPLSMKAYVKLCGDSLNIPVLENHAYYTLITCYNAPKATIANLIFEHGQFQPNGILQVSHSDGITINNIAINPVAALSKAGIVIYCDNFDVRDIKLDGLISLNDSGLTISGDNGIVKNVTINNCHSIGGSLDLVIPILDANIDSTLVLEDVSVTNCSVNNPDNCIASVAFGQSTNPSVRISNLLIANCSSTSQSPLLIEAVSTNPTIMSNCTIVNNSGGSCTAKIIGKMKISNCIFDNNRANEINIRNTQQYGFVSNMTFAHNLIRNYPSSVYSHVSNNVDFTEDNFDAEPYFAGTDVTNPLSYMLNYNSPCIDAGTQDTTGLYLPLTDLFGNPRIYNGTIDIGCHEWNGTASDDENMPISDINSLSIYPNPFTEKTSITYTLDKATDVVIEVYNTKGQRVKTLINAKQAKGGQVIQWEGSDEQGRSCKSGIYVVKLVNNHSKSITKKVTIIK